MSTECPAEEIVARLRAAATDMGRPGLTDAMSGLRAARAVLVDVFPSDVARDLDDQALLAVYFARKLIGDVWYNFFTDATFALDDDERYSEARKHVSELADALSRYLLAAFGPVTAHSPEPSAAQSAAVRAYTETVQVVELQQNRQRSAMATGKDATC